MAEIAENFNAYHKWLGIPPEDQPPNHYQLLGVQAFEDDRDVISNAADQRMRHVRTFQAGKHSELSQQILNELSTARLCLLRPEKKAAYDVALREQRSALLGRQTVGQAAGPPPPTAVFPVAGGPPPIGASAAVATAPQVDYTAMPFRASTQPLPGAARSSRPDKPMVQVWQIGLAAAAVVAIAIGAVIAVLSHGESPYASAGHDEKISDAASSDVLKSESTDADGKPIVDPAAAPAGDPIKSVKPDVLSSEPAPVKPSDLSPQPAVKPPAVASEFTPEQIKQFADFANAARKSMAKLDIDRAKAELDKAAHVVAPDAKMPEAQYLELTRLRNLIVMLQEGVDGLHRGLSELHVGDEIVIDEKDNIKGVVASLNPNVLIVKLNGNPDPASISFDKIPPALAERIEKKAFPPGTAIGKPGMAALHTVHPRGDRNEAKKLLDELAASGSDVKTLLDELPAGFPLASKPFKLPSPVKPPEVKPVPTPPSVPAIVEKNKKLPIPSDELQAKARTQINELFGEDLAKAKKLEEKAALAHILANKARESADNPTDRYVLWIMARDLAADAGDAAAATQAIDGLTLDYEIAPLEMKVDALSHAAKATLGASASKELAESLLSLVTEAVAADNFSAAARLLTAATTVAARAKDPSTGKAVSAARKEVAELQKVADAAKQAADTLRQTPDDPDANLTLGLHLCFGKDDWAKGLPHLAKGGNDDLKAIATAELAKPADANAQVELADLWWALAEKSPAANKLLYQKRAGVWYEKSQPQVSGLVGVKVAKRLKQLEDLVATSEASSLKPKVVKKPATEVHVVRFDGDPQTPSTATIKVTQTDKAIILILSGTNSIVWNVDIAPQVNLKGVIATGRHVQKVNVPKGISVVSSYPKSAAAENYDRLAEKVSGIAGLPPATQHGGKIPTDPVVIGP